MPLQPVANLWLAGHPQNGPNPVLCWPRPPEKIYIPSKLPSTELDTCCRPSANRCVWLVLVCPRSKPNSAMPRSVPPEFTLPSETGKRAKRSGGWKFAKLRSELQSRVESASIRWMESAAIEGLERILRSLKQADAGKTGKKREKYAAAPEMAAPAPALDAR